MRTRLWIVLGQLLLVPVAAFAQQPGSRGGERIAQRLPPSSPTGSRLQTETRTADIGSAPQGGQPVRFVQEEPGPPMETLPAATLAPGPIPGQGLTLADLEAMALANNPSVARAAALVQAARGNHIQVGLPPNPSVGYEGQQIGSGGLAEQDGIFVGQEFVRGVKLRLNRQVAAQEWARAEQKLAAQQQRVITDVRIAFYQVLIAQRQETVTNELLRLARETHQVAENLLEGKEVGRVDVVQAQLESENAEILAENAFNRRIAAWQGLSTVVGNPRLPLEALNGNLEDSRGKHGWDESLQRVLTGSPEIAAAIANVERARWAVERAQVEKTPNVTVQGLVNVRDNGIGGKPDGSISVGIPLPAWNRNQGGIIQAQHEVVAAERALDQLELSLQNRLAVVFERYTNAQKQVAKYRTRILPFAQQSLNLTRQLYQGGETSYVNLLTAQRTYTQTNLNYLESLISLRTAEVEIEGLLLSGSLEDR